MEIQPLGLKNKISGSISNSTVLVVDDEESIRRTLEGVLADEGYVPLCVPDATSALTLLEVVSPEVALVDIWMPGTDGLMLLEHIINKSPRTKVIMMSGHATISTAVRATQRGAVDFIEKPFELETVLSSLRQALNDREGDDGGGASLVKTETDLAKRANNEAPSSVFPDSQGFAYHRIVENLRPQESNQKIRFKRSGFQKTLAHSAILYGQGLHSGKKSGLILEPLAENSGVQFVGVGCDSVVPAHVDFVESTGFATTIRFGDTQAGTIEHLMSALHAYGVSNLLVKCNGEVPVMDGSARDFCALLDEIGTVNQDSEVEAIEILEPFEIRRDKEFIRLIPGEGFTVDYTLKYPPPVGEQRFVFSFQGVEGYKEEIANARTFGFVRDIGALQRQGLALGGRFDNFVLIGEDGPINDKLRYINEPVRHKILDAIGDLYLLGRPIIGRVEASMTGHSDNIALLKELRKQLTNTPDGDEKGGH